MATSTGPFPVTTKDPTYSAVTGYLSGVGFYFRVLDAGGDEVDGQGLDGELPHLVNLLEASWIYISWPTETALVAELRQHDPALSSKHPGVARLLVA